MRLSKKKRILTNRKSLARLGIKYELLPVEI